MGGVDKDKIIGLINNKKFEKANRLIKSKLSKEILSSPQIIEMFFCMLSGIHQRKDILKYLDLNRVPPNPIDTRYDIGRRFFYALVVKNMRGGHRIVKNYLKDIVLHRTLEFRFMGGMNYALLDFKTSHDYFVRCYESIKKDEYQDIYHFHAVSNVLFSAFYSKNFDGYQKYKTEISKTYGDHFALSIGVIDSLLAVKDKNIQELDSLLKKHKFPPVNLQTLLAAQAYLKGDMEGFRKHIKLYMDLYLGFLKKGTMSPRRYFFSMVNFKNLIGAMDKDYEGLFKFDNFSYPLGDNQVEGLFTNPDYQFKYFGDPDAKNYINLKTEEYRFNGEVGIGLKTEMRAIAMIIRAGSFGMSFEYLAGEIYEDVGHSELFQIRERIKQVIQRIKSKYKVKLKVSNFFVYIDPSEVDKFRIDYRPTLSLVSDLSVKNLIESYSISESKARKYIKLLKAS